MSRPSWNGKPAAPALTGRRLAIVVAADLGRSPRMVEHAIAAASCGADVDLVGFGGRETPADLAASGVRIHRVEPVGRGLPGAAGPLALGGSVLRATRQGIRLAGALRRLAVPDAVLCTSPPALPTLAVVTGAARRWNANLVIDWHNLSASLLALKVGARHPAVGLVHKFEKVLGRRAHGHLCVSEAMRDRLLSDLNVVEVVVLYDRPADRFRRAGRDRKVERPRHDRPVALLVAPSGWTLDEDPGTLLEALTEYDRAACQSLSLPDVEAVVSGDGPLRRKFEERIEELILERVTVRTGWLSTDEYVQLLQHADLGISLHRSSSGVDLAMKVADMQGAGLPICAFDYGACLREQVQPEVDAALFGDGQNLGEVLIRVLRDFPHPGSELVRLQQNAATIDRPSWQDEWPLVVPGVLDIDPMRQPMCECPATAVTGAGRRTTG